MSNNEAVEGGGDATEARRLDAEIERVVFGRDVGCLHLKARVEGTKIVCDECSDWWGQTSFAMNAANMLTPYSWHIHAAWKIVEAMEDYCCDFTLEKTGAEWHADFRVGSALGATAPEAICNAALSALRSPSTESVVLPPSGESTMGDETPR